MTLLDEIIDASTNSSTDAADLLRKVQVVARRLGAADVEQWVRSELSGYEEGAILPPYRKLETHVIGHFTGPMQSWRNEQISTRLKGSEDLWRISLRQPLLEIQALSEGDSDPQRPWSTWNVQKYRESGGDGVIGMHLFSAANVISRQTLRGIVDTIRSRALDFALDLQAQAPDAGEVGGPTLSSLPELAQTVNNFTITNNITGHGVNVATGSNIHQRSQVLVGDIDSLRKEARALGLTDEDAEEFVEAVVAERTVDSSRVSGFLAKVRSGALTITGSLASDVVAGSLIELAKGFLGV